MDSLELERELEREAVEAQPKNLVEWSDKYLAADADLTKWPWRGDTWPVAAAEIEAEQGAEMLRLSSAAVEALEVSNSAGKDAPRLHFDVEEGRIVTEEEQRTIDKAAEVVAEARQLEDYAFKEWRNFSTETQFEEQQKAERAAWQEYAAEKAADSDRPEDQIVWASEFVPAADPLKGFSLHASDVEQMHQGGNFPQLLRVSLAALDERQKNGHNCQTGEEIHPLNPDFFHVDQAAGYVVTKEEQQLIERISHGRDDPDPTKPKGTKQTHENTNEKGAQPMIIEGNKLNPCSRSGSSANLAEHLQRTDTNEKAAVLEIRGFASDDLAGAFNEINATAAATRASKAAYHAKINPMKGETLTEEQATAAADKLEKALGFEGQPRALVEHVKDGRQHFHVVWSRIDLEKGKAIDTPENYRTHERVAVELENDFHLTPTPTRAHERKPEQSRPEQNAEKWQYQQAERLQTKTPREQKAEITALYGAAKDGKELQAALADHGYTLARGDKEGILLVVDERGGFASLTRRVEGAKKAEIEAKTADIDRAKLPTLDQARGLVNVKAEQIEQRQGQPADLMEALEKRKYILARASAEDVRTYAKLRETAKEDGFAKLPPELREGQLCAVSKAGRVVFLSERTTGLPADQIKTQLKAVEAASLPDVRLAAATNKMAENLKAEAKTQDHIEGRAADKLRAELSGARLTDQEKRDQIALQKLSKTAAQIEGRAERGALRVIGCTLNKAGAVLDGVAKVAEAILDLFAPPVPRKITPQEMARSKEAFEEYKTQLRAEEKATAALDRISEQVRQDKTLTYADMASLGRASLEELKMRGDDALIAMCRRREEENERDGFGGRRMER